MNVGAHPPAGPRGEKPGQAGPRGEAPGSGAGPSGPRGEKPGQAGPRGETPGSGTSSSNTSGSSSSSSAIGGNGSSSEDGPSSELKALMEQLKKDHDAGNKGAEQQDQQRIQALLKTLGGQ